jgi:NADH-quinone oxidoreductase subunit E
MQAIQQKLKKTKLDEIISRYQDQPGGLLGILEEAQKINPHKYLPQETLEYIAEKTHTALSKIYKVITFYAFFNLEPQGEHSIIVCRGTACHTRRSKNLLDYLINEFGFKANVHDTGEKTSFTTQDNKFTIKTVACFGQCALAPVVEVDGNIYSHMTEVKLRKIIKDIQNNKSKT